MSIPLIDCHQHLINSDFYPYSWRDDIPQLANKAFTYNDYLDLTKDKGEIRTIFMETTPDEPHGVDESKYVMELADDPNSIVEGMILHCFPEREDDFDAYLDSIQHEKLVGLRRILHVVDDEVSQQQRFVDNIKKLEARNLTFDLCLFPRQLYLAGEIATKCENIQFVLDHCGIPDIANNEMDPWREEIKKVASYPNIACKISGVLAYCSPDNANAEAIRPYLEHSIECFGWDRVVWGSDWPLCAITSGLPQWIDITRELFAEEDVENQHKLYHKNAERIYLKRNLF